MLAASFTSVQAVLTGACVRLHTDSQNAIGWLFQGWKRQDFKLVMLCAQID